jgi:SHOCT-like protein
MTDPLERVLELVASGRLTAEEAAPILDALEAKATQGTERDASAAGTDGEAQGQGGHTAGNARFARVEVRESGRRIVDLRVPISLGRFALSRVPGLSSQQIADVEEAVTSGAHGPILDVQDADGDGVRIILE